MYRSMQTFRARCSHSSIAYGVHWPLPEVIASERQILTETMLINHLLAVLCPYRSTPCAFFAYTAYTHE